MSARRYVPIVEAVVSNRAVKDVPGRAASCPPLNHKVLLMRLFLEGEDRFGERGDILSLLARCVCF